MKSNGYPRLGAPHPIHKARFAMPLEHSGRMPIVRTPGCTFVILYKPVWGTFF